MEDGLFLRVNRYFLQILWDKTLLCLSDFVLIIILFHEGPYEVVQFAVLEDYELSSTGLWGKGSIS